jgi:hypothetical protein
VAPRLLPTSAASAHAPRLGVLAWLAATVSAAASWAVAGVVLAFPVLLAAPGRFLDACLVGLGEVLVGPVDPVPRTAGLVVVGAVLARLGWVVTATLVRGRRQRQRHAEMLRIVGRPLPYPHAVLVEDATPTVYCLPGRTRQIVVSRGALRALDPAGLQAVLAHERAHLAGRHHLLAGALSGLARAFPGVPLAMRAPAEVGRMLEMCADDAAVRGHGPVAVMGAMASLMHASPAPAGTLGATGTGAAERVARLAEPGNGDAGRRRRLVTATAVLATGPLVAAGVPLLIAAAHHLLHCPPMAG